MVITLVCQANFAGSSPVFPVYLDGSKNQYKLFAGRKASKLKI